MEIKRNKKVPLIVVFLVAGVLSQNLAIPVMASSFDDQKQYYSPDPHARSPPGGSHHTPSHRTPPSHGSGGGGGCGGSPPSCGGGGGCGGSPPSCGGYRPPPTPSGGNCGTPPYTPTPRPSTPRIPPYSPRPRPSTPRNPPHDPPRTPSTPRGGYYRPPTPLVASPPPTTPTPIVTSPPPYTPSPIVSSPPPYTPTPIVSSPPPYTPTPIVSSPPPSDPGTLPGTPSTPGILPGTPIGFTPPFLPDPNSNPFTGTCNYWSTHPGLIWGLFGWWATLGNAFGTHSLPGLGGGLSLQQALTNTRTDGFGSLYREGTASLLNSMVNNKFPFTTDQVRKHFISALSSNKAAASQAQQFKMANEGRLRPRA